MKVTTAMLADHAIQALGKLYIHGGAWEVINAPPGDPNDPIPHNMSLVLVVQSDWEEANEDLPLNIRLLDADRQPLLEARGQMRFGRAPEAEVGDPALSPFVADFQGLVLPRAGLYMFSIEDGQGNVLSEVPFRVRRQPG